MTTDGSIPVSNSEIQQFKSCRRQWYFGTYRGLGPLRDDLIGPLPFGTRMHTALESYYTDGVVPTETWSELVAVDRLKLVAEERDASELDKEAELGRIMLEGYLEWLEETGADSEWDVVSAEQELAVPLLDGKVTLVGKVDMRVRRKSDGNRLFVDHKSAANISDVSKTASVSEQFLQYLLLEISAPDQNNDTYCDGGVYNILRKVKRTGTARPPFYQRIEVHHNKLALRAYWTRVHGVIRDILATREALDRGADPNYVAYPTPTRDCSWKCKFFAVCGMFDDGSAVEEAISYGYRKRDPYERYKTIREEQP